MAKRTEAFTNCPNCCTEQKVTGAPAQVCVECKTPFEVTQRVQRDISGTPKPQIRSSTY